MENDDLPVGRILPRREVLAFLGVTGLALLSGHGRASQAGTALACIVSPELTEGPYYVAEDSLSRSDIRADSSTGAAREGAKLRLLLSVSQVGSSCTPLAGAIVEIWNCDAAGVYSGVSDPGFETSAEDYLRGAQVTDALGSAEFVTIYPGWYAGRAVHIHFKVRTPAGLEFTSQLFFDDAFTAEVYAAEPYAARGLPDAPNSADFIYSESDGQLLLAVRATDDGYVGMYDIGMVAG